MSVKVVNITHFWHYGNNKTKKVSRLFQKELSIVFQKEVAQFCGNVMISITTVRVSPDLVNANIF